jgi:hypothetical protein
MFQLPEMTMATINSVTPRVEKHGDEDKPAVSIKLSIEGPNTLLDAIDPGIRQALYKAKPDETPELDGIEPATPILRCNSFEKTTLTTAHEGWTLAVDNDIDDTAPMKFGGCKVDRFAVEAKQGGSIVLQIRVGTSDIDADRLGWLGMHNGEAIWITLMPPEKKPDAIDGTGEEFKKDHPDAPGPDAGSLFAQEHGGQASKDALDAVGSPFGAVDKAADLQTPAGDKPADLQSSTSTRTARGREATKKALADGLAAHAAAEGQQA